MSATIQLAPLHKYIELTERKRVLKAELTQVEEALRQVEPLVTDALMELGDDEQPGHMRVGGMTLYLKQELWARPRNGDREATAHALKEAGLDWLVKEDFNVNSLSAWVREVKAKGEDASGEEAAQLRYLLDHIELTEGYKVAARKVGPRSSR